MTLQLDVIRLGRMEYGSALEAQKRRVEERVAGKVADALFLVEHPPVLTQGSSGEAADVLVDEEELKRRGVRIFTVERGGKATFHGPGQLVAYPVILLRDKDLHEHLRKLLDVSSAVLRAWGLEPAYGLHGPGMWVNGAKIASVGMAVRKWVTFHGVAINVSTDLDWFTLINPCGVAGEMMTSMQRELGASNTPGMKEVEERFVWNFRRVFGYMEAPSLTRLQNRSPTPERPQWLHVRVPQAKNMAGVERLLERLELETVCQQAECPNMGECFSSGTSTFMILGAVCTRGCRYCAVHKGSPQAPDPGEPERVARAVETLRLRHAVITSVTRDDLPDGGAAHFVRTVEAVRTRCPGVSVEILTPDFAGSLTAARHVCRARPSVFNHNIETVRRLFPGVRPLASYDRSLRVLACAADEGLPVKSGIMLGLGELRDEIHETLADIFDAGCRFVTMGQYLSPTTAHHPIDRYVTPEEFENWAALARSMGFTGVASGPLVRSSYRAEAMFERGKGRPCPLNDGKTPHTPCREGSAI
ncbi:MAG: lipoyl synthase [Desulfovibrio sp.]|jgi:lipoic acid synthetase|nr:lipoyl synthase [Desulfovibrio sp.]